MITQWLERGAGLVAMMLAATVGAQAGTLYVSPAGRAGAPGTIDRPLPSITAARDAIRAARRAGAAGPETVLLRGGFYYLPETFVLTPEDSDVTYAAYAGERPILSGGRRIAGWKKGPDNIWSASADWEFRQLFINGRRATRARTPNNGFYRIDGASSQDRPFLLKYRGNDIREDWAGSGAEVVALLAWAEIRMPILEVNPETHVARLAANPPAVQQGDRRALLDRERAGRARFGGRVAPGPRGRRPCSTGRRRARTWRATR